MTDQAREVLEDCRLAVSKLQDGISGRDWRIAWVTAVTLLRTIGHVLKKVDAKSNPKMGLVIETSWAQLVNSKPEPKIFWDFIEDERNNILKEYRLSAGQGVTVRPGMLTINLQTGELNSEPGLPTLYHYVMNSGPYTGQDQREVLAEALSWWDEYLRNIEQQMFDNS